MVSVSSTLNTPTFRPSLRDTSVAKPAPKAGFFRRILDAIIESNQRRADREIAAFIAMRGGKLTDSLERQVQRRFVRGESAFDVRRTD